MRADSPLGWTLPLWWVVLGLLGTGCIGQPEDFEVRSVSIADFSALGNEETVVGIDIGLHNPNGYKVQIEDSRLGLWVGADSVGVLQFVKSFCFLASQPGQSGYPRYGLFSGVWRKFLKGDVHINFFCQFSETPVSDTVSQQDSHQGSKYRQHGSG